MPEQLAPPQICFFTGFLLIVIGIVESILGARRSNVLRQRGGYGMIAVAVIFVASGLILLLAGVR